MKHEASMKREASNPTVSRARRGWLGGLMAGAAALVTWRSRPRPASGAPAAPLPPASPRAPEPPRPVRLSPAPHSVKRHG